MKLKIRRLVKNNIKHFLNTMVAFVTVTVFFSACNERNDLGLELLPGEDLINVAEVKIQDDISAFTFTEENLVSSGGQSLLGSLNDPVFGSTNVNFASQFRITSYVNFGNNPVADSVKLYLYYNSVYGDTITPHNFKVYELESPLSLDEQYTQDIDLKSMASDQLLGEIDLVPTIKVDSTSNDTLLQLITIPLDPSIGDKLLNIDSTIITHIDSFLTAFKGLYIESRKIDNSTGSLLSLQAAASGSFQGSALLVYYNNDENMALEITERDTLTKAFIITENSARVNSIQHDYSGTPFEANLNQEVVVADYLYIQPTGGLKSKVLIDGLENWKDSVVITETDTVRYAINRAELVVQMDTIETDMENFTPPGQLLFTFIDEDGEEKLPLDYFFNPTYFGGYMNSDYTYRFNITQHVQQIIDGTVGNNGFFLSTGRQINYANRVILEGTNRNGIKLQITYSKFLQ